MLNTIRQWLKVGTTQKKNSQQNARLNLLALEERINPVVTQTLTGPASIQVGPVVNTDRLPGYAGEPFIAQDPTSPNRLFMTANGPFTTPSGLGFTVGFSTDVGRTWNTRVIADGTDGLPAACCDGQISWDTFGNLFVTYLAFTPAGSRAIVLNSIDGGQSFNVVLNAPTFDQPSIAVGANSVWISHFFTDGTNQGIVAQGATVTGLGAVGLFTNPQFAGAGNFGGVAINPTTGAVAVTYQTNVGGQGQANVQVHVDPDGLGPAGFGAAVTATTTNVGGFDFNPVQPRRSFDSEAGLAYDPSGNRLYLVYTDEEPDESNDFDIYVRFSDDNGATWSNRVRVHSFSPNIQALPYIQVDQSSGVVGVFYRDARFSPQNNTVQSWVSFSLDRGLTFIEAPVQTAFSNAAGIPDPNEFGDYNGAAFVGGSLFGIWVDNSNSTGDNPNGANSFGDSYTAAANLVVDVTITAQGALGADDYRIALDPTGTYVIVFENGQARSIALLSNVQQITINGGGGNDTIAVDYTNGFFTIPNGIFLNGGVGTDTLRVIGDVAATLNGSTLIVNGTNNVTFAGFFQENVELIGSTGTSNFTVNDFIGRVFIDGRDGNDIFNIDTSVNGADITINDTGTNDADVGNLLGSAANENFLVALEGTNGTVDLQGTNRFVTINGLETTAIDGRGGTNTLTVVDNTNLSFGSGQFLNPALGMIYTPQSLTGGRLVTGQNTGVSTIVFTNINGDFVVNGDGNNSGDVDMLVVLGASATSLNSGPAFNETNLFNGSDTILADDTTVRVTNVGNGELKPITIGYNGNTPTFNTLVIRSGNERPLKGDDVFITPSTRLFIFADGGAPGRAIPSDRITIVSPNPISDQIVGFIGAGEQHLVTDLVTGAQAGYVNFEPAGIPPIDVPTIVAATGPGMQSQFQVFDGNTLNQRFVNIVPFPAFTGGIRTAVGDVNGDFVPDIIIGAGPGGGPAVKVYDGATGAEMMSFFAFTPLFTGGVNVAVAGDFNGDGLNDILVGAGAGGGPHVRIFSGLDASELVSFFAYVPQFTGGVSVSGGDINGDGNPDIIVGAGVGGGPHVQVFNVSNLSILASFFAYDPGFTGGVLVSTGDINGDGLADVITTPATTNIPHVRAFDGNNLNVVLSSFFAGSAGLLLNSGVPLRSIPQLAGVTASAVDINNDGIDEIVTADGAGTLPRVIVYNSQPVFPLLDFLVADGIFGGGIFVGGGN